MSNDKSEAREAAEAEHLAHHRGSGEGISCRDCVAFLSGWNAALERAAQMADSCKQGGDNPNTDHDDYWEWKYNRDVSKEIRSLKEAP